MSFGSDVRKVRKRAGLSKKALAERAGLKKKDIQGIEDGDLIPNNRNYGAIRTALSEEIGLGPHDMKLPKRELKDPLPGKPVKVRIVTDCEHTGIITSVYINGVDISDRVTNVDYAVKTGELPNLYLEMFPDVLEILAEKCAVTAEADK